GCPLEWGRSDAACEPMAVKFVEHFLWIAAAMNRFGDDGMWDEEDGFFYDVLRLPDGRSTRLHVRSLVGLLPLCAVTVVPGDFAERYPRVLDRVRSRLGLHPALARCVGFVGRRGGAGRHILSLLDESRLRRVLARLLDEGEFLGPFGLRALSRVHAAEPYVFAVGGREYRVAYEPAESRTELFGGNS